MDDAEIRRRAEAYASSPAPGGDDLSTPEIRLRTPFSSSEDAPSSPQPPQDDEGLRQWHAERIERRLRGEYERSSRLLSELVSDNLEKPSHLAAIRIDGAEHTRPSFLASLCTPFLAPERAPKDLRSILATTRELSHQLSRFDAFADVQATLERSPSVLADPGDVDLVLGVREAPRFFLKTATDVGNGEGNATGTARVRNAFGGAETLEAAVSFGTRTRSSFQARLETPIPFRPSPDTTLEISGNVAERDLSHYASCRERIKGAQFRLRTLSALGFHDFAYEATDRHIADLEPHASLSMRQAAGHTVKSALSHTLMLRDAAGRGRVKLLQEYAGLGGDAHHVKLDGESSYAFLLGGNRVLTAGFRSGLLYPLGGKPSLFSDRFQLGGPTSVRSFKVNGIGPKDNGDFIGGDLHWSAGLSVFSPIPRREHWPVQLHTFLNAGRLVSMRQDRSLVGNVGQLLHRPAASAGFGIVYSPGASVRLEINFGLPLMAASSDATRKGLAVGIGIDFL